MCSGSSISNFNMIQRFFLFVICLIIVLFSLDKAIKFLLLKNINFKSAYIAKHPIEADIIIHGPCEPEWMIDPSIIDSKVGSKTYNLSLNHSDFADNYLHLYLYLKHQKAPQYLFLYATPVSFDEKLANTFNTYRFAPFIRDSIVYKTVKENDPSYAKYSFIPVMRFAYYSDFTYLKAIQGGYYFLTNRINVEHPDGYAPALSSWNTAISEYRANHSYFKKMNWSNLREKYFRKTIELAQSKEIKVIIYESPIYKPDEAQLVNRKVMMDKIKSVTDNYKVPFLVFDTLAMANNRENFFSTYNTTYKGSCEFSSYFANYIKNNIYKKGNVLTALPQ